MLYAFSEETYNNLFLSVAKLRCTPRRGQLRNIIQNAESYERYIIPGSKGQAKKSDIEEGKIVYNEDGLPVDTSNTVVKAFKSYVYLRYDNKDINADTHCYCFRVRYTFMK